MKALNLKKFLNTVCAKMMPQQYLLAKKYFPYESLKEYHRRSLFVNNYTTVDSKNYV